MNFLLRMNVVEIWFVVVWGLCCGNIHIFLYIYICMYNISTNIIYIYNSYVYISSVKSIYIYI